MDEVAAWIVEWAESPFAVLALALFTFVEAIFLPLPPEPLLIVLALMHPQFGLALGVLCTAASVSGGVVGYIVGKRGGRPLLVRLFGHERLAPVDRLYRRFGPWAVLAAALSPIPYKLCTLSAGTFGVSLRHFVLASLLGRGLRYIPIGLLITLFGEAFQPYLRDYLEFMVIVAVVLLVVGVLASVVAGRRVLSVAGR